MCLLCQGGTFCAGRANLRAGTPSPELPDDLKGCREIPPLSCVSGWLAEAFLCRSVLFFLAGKGFLSIGQDQIQQCPMVFWVCSSLGAVPHGLNAEGG